MSSNLEYHQLLEYLYFNNYADSYENVEHLIQQLSDEEYQDLYENTGLGGNKRAHGAKVDQRVTDAELEDIRASAKRPRPSASRPQDDSLEAMKERFKEEEEGEKVKPVPSRGIGAGEPVLGGKRKRKPGGMAQIKANKLRRGSTQAERERGKKISAALKNKKKWGTPEARNEAYVLEHLISEGYADNYNSAAAICESMSDEWFYSIISEEFKDLTPEKEERVRNRVGELARDIQVSGARMKKLNKKPFGKYRPKVRAEKESILKSARKKHKLVKNASDALTRTSISREAGIVKKMYDLKKRMDDELNG